MKSKKVHTLTDGYDLILNNVYGEKVFSDKIVNRKSYIVHLDLPSGIYFLHIKTHDGVTVKKIVRN